MLVISHNSFSKTGNMGKTMLKLLECVPDSNLAQLFFHNDTPVADCRCGKYYRITDVDMVKSVVSRKAGYRIYSFDTADIRTEEATNKTIHNIYQYSRRRKPYIYIARNTMWRMGVWDTPELNRWIKDFSPDVIFFAAGDYAFAYKIVYTLARRYGISVVPWFGDDFLLKEINSTRIFQKYVRNNLLKRAKKIFSLSPKVITISDKMAAAYRKNFSADTEVVRISVDQPEDILPSHQRKGIYYMGNLGVGRITPLLKLGRAIKQAQLPGLEYINVYSGEKRENILSQLTEENGIVFHGMADAGTISGIQRGAKYLLHIEADDAVSKNRTRYSLSTKIAECLASGGCIAACGPADIASMEYLADNQCAAFSKNAEGLVSLIAHLEENTDEYDAIVANSLVAVKKYHNSEINNKKAREILCFSAGQEG